jgi:hypothetical protein
MANPEIKICLFANGILHFWHFAEKKKTPPATAYQEG